MVIYLCPLERFKNQIKTKDTAFEEVINQANTIQPEKGALDQFRKTILGVLDSDSGDDSRGILHAP